MAPYPQASNREKGATRSGRRKKKVEHHELSVNMSISDGKGPNFVDFGLSM